MNPTYQIVGADGQVYGPVSLEDLLNWIREGRIVPETQVLRSDQTEYQSASAFSELGLTAAAPAPATPVAVRVGATPAAEPAAPARPVAAVPGAPVPALEQQIRGGASWFYWIAGLSLINTIVSLTGSGWGFIIGLGITQVFDAIAQEAGAGGKTIALILDLGVLAVFVFFGVFANKKHRWAFIVGMVLYGLDGLIFLMLQDWLAFGFHVFAFFCIFKGFQACRAYYRLAGPS